MKTAPRALFYTAWTLIFATIGLGGWLLAQALGPALAASRLTLALVVWAAVWLLTLGLLTWRLPEADLWFLPPAALLNGWGLLLIARTAQTFLWRQVAWSGVSCAVLTLLALTPALPRWLRRYRYTVLAAGLILLLATFGIGVNPSGYGPRLWLGLAGFYFQPSELLKIMLVVYLAAYLAERREALVQRGGREWHLWPTVLGPMLSMIGLALVLLAWQQDLGAALLFSLTFLALLYLAWGKVWPLLGGTLLLGPILTLGTLFSSRVALRVSIWLDPWAEAQADRAFQIRQALFALGAGGLIGQGPGWGAPNFVPVVHTDFPYVALVEEYGLIGAAAALLLIAWLVSAGLRVAQRAQTSFESLLAGGLAALLGIQTLIIVGGNIKLIPLTGVPFPFLSYGGSSLFMLGVMLGLWLNLSAPHVGPLDLAVHADELPSLTCSAARLGRGLLLALFLELAITGYWSILRAEWLRTYPTNPRRVLAEQRLQRGRILDRQGLPLAENLVDTEGFAQRMYPYPAAAPVTGYATLEHGHSELEAACDAALRGEVEQDWKRQLWRDLTRQPVRGQDVAVTLDVRLQQRAQALLLGRRGAALLFDTHTGAILALASSPTYDPNRIVTEWETLREAADAPLLNRVTQGPAQPGGALATVLLGLTLKHELPLVLTEDITRPVTVAQTSYACRLTPQAVTWSEVLRAQCPAPLVTLGEQLGPERLAEGLKAWGLVDPPAFELPVAGGAWHLRRENLVAESLGQGELLVTPFQLAGVVAVLGNDGVRPPLHLLRAAQAGCPAPAGDAPRLLSLDQAAFLRQTWPAWGEAIGYLSEAQAGPQRTLSWFLGLNSAQLPRYGVVVLIENPPVPAYAAFVGQALLRAAPAP